MSPGGSSSSSDACTTIDNMSSVGRARFSAINARPYAIMSKAAGSRSVPLPARKSKPGSTAANSSWRSSSATPSRKQIICSGSSAATSTRKSTGSPSGTASSSATVRRRSSPSRLRSVSGRQSLAHQATDPTVARVVHHVEHDAGHRQVLEERAAVGPVAAGLRREEDRLLQDVQHLGVGGDRPEALAVGRVLGRRVPPDRCLARWRSNSSCGKPAAKLSRSVRSTPSMTTGGEPTATADPKTRFAYPRVMGAEATTVRTTSARRVSPARQEKYRAEKAADRAGGLRADPARRLEGDVRARRPATRPGCRRGRSTATSVEGRARARDVPGRLRSGERDRRRRGGGGTRSARGARSLDRPEPRGRLRRPPAAPRGRVVVGRGVERRGLHRREERGARRATRAAGRRSCTTVAREVCSRTPIPRPTPSRSRRSWARTCGRGSTAIPPRSPAPKHARTRSTCSDARWARHA